MRERNPSPKGIQGPLSKALDNHFVTCAAVAAAAVVTGQTQQAHADIVYSGIQNIELPNGTGGIYINLVTNSSSGSRVTGWDINPYVNSPYGVANCFGIYLPTSTQLVQSSTAAPTDPNIAKLTAGALIGPTSIFIGQTVTLSSWPSALMNNDSTGDWTTSGTGYLGLQFTESGVNGGNPVYGWVQISKAAAGEPATGGPSGIIFVDWAYDDSGSPIAAGATVAPEPSSLALLAAGAMGLLARRGQLKLRRSAA